MSIKLTDSNHICCDCNQELLDATRNKFDHGENSVVEESDTIILEALSCMPIAMAAKQLDFTFDVSPKYSIYYFIYGNGDLNVYIAPYYTVCKQHSLLCRECLDILYIICNYINSKYDFLECSKVFAINAKYTSTPICLCEGYHNKRIMARRFHIIDRGLNDELEDAIL